MKPYVHIDFNEVFANTPVYDELSAVIFGAELALKHANTSDAQLKDIRTNIVRSAFDTFSLDYEKMFAAAQPKGAAAPARSSAEAEPVKAESPEPEEPEGSEKNDSSNTPAPPAEEEAPAPPAKEDDAPEPAVINEPAEAGAVEDVNYEQTVVYENYPESEKAGSNPEPAGSGESPRENIWGETENSQGEGFGKIQWTTYSSGDELTDASPDQ